MSQRFAKLVTLLKELFQLDQPDLDFGFYRVMHAKSAEVTQFLERDLLPQVKTAFAQYQPADKAAIEIEQRLGDPKVMLDSFIVSNTPSHVMRKQWGIEKPEMVKRHILFQEEDKDSYIGAMLRGAALRAAARSSFPIR